MTGTVNNISKNRQLFINMLSSIVAFSVNLGINFFLTPFVVERLGIEAYGFLGLSSNIIGYTTLITIALNSMAGRFITISYQNGKIEEANKYFSSVFFSNLVLSGIVALVLLLFLFNLEKWFEVPSNLVIDVKLLFSFSIFTTLISLLGNVYAIATFIKNRLDLSSIRQIIGNIIRGILVIVLFGFFPPHLWYYGLVGVVVSLYIIFTNIKFTQLLTPEFHISVIYYDWTKVKDLLSAGVWNLVNQLGDILGKGFNLIIANVFISAVAMGYYSMTLTIPSLIHSLFVMISGVFAPMFTILYAQQKHDELKSELMKAIRICGFFANIPLVCLFAFGDDFYALWLPNEDSSKLQLLTIVGSINSVISMPMEPLWNIFTITNRLKYSTLFIFGQNILIFATLMASMVFVDSSEYRLLILAGAGTFWNNVKNLTFLPLYGAHCLGIDKFTFYKPLLKSVLAFVISLSIGILLSRLFTISTWLPFTFVVLLMVLICLFINSAVMLNKCDRDVILKKVIKKF